MNIQSLKSGDECLILFDEAIRKAKDSNCVLKSRVDIENRIALSSTHTIITKSVCWLTDAKVIWDFGYTKTETNLIPEPLLIKMLGSEDKEKLKATKSKPQQESLPRRKRRLLTSH